MCFDPVSIAVISGVASGVGTMISASGQMASASAQAASYNAQAGYSERNAKMEVQKGVYERDRLTDSNDRQLAGMRGQYMSSGIALEGSAVDVLTDSATEASLDEQAIRYGSQVRSDNLRFEASLARTNAKSAMTGGRLAALGTMVGGLAQTASQYQQATMIKNPYAMGA